MSSSRFRGLCVETLEDRRLLTGVSAMDGAPLIDGPAEGESATLGTFVSGQLLVQFKEGVTQQAIQQLVAAEGATIAQTFYGLDNFALVNLSFYNHQGGSMAEYATISAQQGWENKQQVEYAALNHYVHSTAFPDDPLFAWQWGLHNPGTIGMLADADIDAPEAWDMYRGNESVVVAVIDTGVDYTHPDLRPNMWVNTGEIPGNAIDDDGNGWVDDVHGAAPAVGGASGDPRDYDLEVGHGTHVAGILGAVGNNGIGVSGVNWDVTIMGVNVLNDSTGGAAGTEAVMIAGISYVTMMRQDYGVNVLVSNNSYGFDPGVIPSQAVRNAIQQHINAGILYVAAAGNDTNANDLIPSYPASYDLPGIISVGASDSGDFPATFSNFGNISVDLFAPGVDIYSTAPTYISSADLIILEGAGYQPMQGTSMASPFVAGVAALVRGLAPDMTVLETKQLILDNVDRNVYLTPYCVTGGRLNAEKTLAAIQTTKITGNVFLDRNGNGARNTLDQGIPNWTVYLDLNRNNKFDAADAWDTTDGDGNYQITTSVRPGTYTVGQILEPQWTSTYPPGGKHTINILRRGDVITRVDFGNMPLPGAVQGIKWNDLDGDAVKDPNEPGIPGVYIYADLNNDGFIALGEPAAVTDRNGFYRIHDVPAGLVAIREVPSPGWALTYPALGYYMVDVQADTTVTNLNFGNTAAFDFGDAPAPYPTLISQGGAQHGILPGFNLGTLVDAEANGVPTADADGDDLLNLADEDGVVFPDTLYAGTTGEVEVTVTSLSYPAGFLQGWIDFNSDGDWSDPGENIIANRLLSTGVYDITFPVPENVVVGHTYARFRFSSDADLATAGSATAGEVEDYQILVLSNEPVANPDSFEVEQGVINEPLDVLVNDYPSSSGVLAIIGVTQPALGSVRIVGNGIQYSARSAVSPPVEQFTYTISDGLGGTSTTTVTVFVRAQILTPVAVDDNYRVVPGSSGEQLHVLMNDMPGVLGTMEITGVTNPATGTAFIDDNNTPGDPLDDFIVYTPSAAFDTVDTFQYTISNANGDSTATVTIFEDPAPDTLTVDLNLEVVDLEGNPITQIDVGDQFMLVASAQDRRVINEDRAGIYAIYMDVLYERMLVAPNFDAENVLGFEIAFSEDYLNATSGDVNTPGLINEVGSIQSGTGSSLGSDELEVFRIVFTATEVGLVTFLGDPADVRPDHDVLYYDPPSVVPLASIHYGLASLDIVDPNAGSSGIGGGGSQQGDPLDVNFDGYISPIDALMVVNHLNTGGTPGQRLDVNHDKWVTPIDALLVINYLNRRGGAGEGEGEGGDLLLQGSGSAGTTSNLLEAPQLWNALGALPQDTEFEPVVAGTVSLVAPPSLTPAADWQLRVGQAGDRMPALAAGVSEEAWESLLNTLAEDVLEAWLDGEDA